MKVFKIRFLHVISFRKYIVEYPLVRFLSFFGESCENRKAHPGGLMHLCLSQSFSNAKKKRVHLIRRQSENLV